MRVFGKSIGEDGKAIFLKEIHGPMVGNFDALIYYQQYWLKKFQKKGLQFEGQTLVRVRV